MPVCTLFLVGFMGSGKTTVGHELARRLGWDFVDLDARIETIAGQTVPEIFRLRGESGFREAESNALRDLLEDSHQHRRIVALGGGAFVQAQNREALQNVPTVFLSAPAAELWRRCQQDQAERPLRQNPTQFADLYAERLPLYRKASVIVETSGKAVADICAEIEQALGLGPASGETPKSSGVPAANQARSK